MRKRRYLYFLPLFASAGMAAQTSTAYAQQPGPASPKGTVEQPIQYSPSSQAASQRGASQVGGIALKLMDTLIMVYPSVNLGVQHNDNIFSAPNNKTGDQILVLTPALRLESKQAGNTYSLRMSTSINKYQNNTTEDYTNYNIGGGADLNLGTRLRANLSADYTDGVDPRGSTNNPLSSTPDRYRNTYARGLVSYGAAGAPGRIDFELGKTLRNYYNNRAVTAANDRSVDDLGTTFYWRVGPKTSLILHGKHSRVDYALSTSTLNSIENTLQAGATWEASARTTGTFKFGMTKKDFDDAARANSSTLSWSGDVRWSPRTYSHVNVTLSRAPAETTGGVGDFIARMPTSVSWTHEWSSRLSTVASVSYTADAYQGADRKDNSQSYGLKATYKMRRWLSFGGDYGYSTRNSSDSNFNFRRNLFMLFVNATL